LINTPFSVAFLLAGQ